eukprot:m.226534 g.226534  ORF g.226534 m.226534 type:complete len:252 (+) comp18800_c0_seq1:1167-1922(+)
MLSAALRALAGTRSVLPLCVRHVRYCGTRHQPLPSQQRQPARLSATRFALSHLSTSTSRESPSPFEDAVEWVKTSPTADVDNEMKLKFYALFKQATSGPCTDSKPSVLRIVERAKWSAWSNLGDMSKDEAAEAYVREVQALQGGGGTDADSNSSQQQEEALLVEVADGVATLTLNRPKKLNSFNDQLYRDVDATLRSLASNPDVSVAVLTGAGSYYSRLGQSYLFNKQAQAHWFGRRAVHWCCCKTKGCCC